MARRSSKISDLHMSQSVFAHLDTTEGICKRNYENSIALFNNEFNYGIKAHRFIK